MPIPEDCYLIYTLSTPVQWKGGAITEGQRGRDLSTGVQWLVAQLEIESIVPPSPQFSSCLPSPPPHQDAEGFQSIFPSSLLPRTDSDHSCGCDLIERSERIPGPLGPPPSSPASPHSLGSMIDLRTGELCAGQTLSPSPGVWDSCGQADSREGLAVLQKQRQHFPGGQKKKNVVKRVTVLWICLK